MGRLVAVAAWVLALAGPARADGPPPVGRIETRRLENGLTVILAPAASARGLVSVRLRVHVGSSADPPPLIGLAHLVEHMVAALPWDRQGSVFDYLCWRTPQVSCNAETRRDTTDFYATMPRQYLRVALWAHTQFLGATASDFNRVEVARERAIVRNELRQKLDGVPYVRASLRLGELLGVPVASVGSDEESVQALDLVDERPVADFYRRHYGPAAATLVITGDFSMLAVDDLIDDTVALVPRSPVGPTPPGRAAPLAHAGRETYLERPGVAPALLMAWPSPAYFAPGDATADVMAHVLVGLGGRLTERLTRPGGPASFLSARQASRPGTSAFVIRVQLHSDQQVTPVEAQLDEVIREIATRGVTDDELAAARAHWHTLLATRLETPESRAEVLLSWHEQKGDVAAGYAADWRRYDEVTAEDVQAFARNVLVSARRVIVEAVAATSP